MPSQPAAPTPPTPQTPSTPPVPTPAAPAPTVTPATQTPSAPRSNKKLFLIIGGILLVLLLIGGGGGGYYYYTNYFNIPQKVKERATSAHPAFEDYARSVNNMASHARDLDLGGIFLKESADIQRNVSEGERLAKEESEGKEKLTPLVEKLNIKPMATYKKHLNTYLEKTKELAEMDKQVTKMASIYQKHVKDYRDAVILLTSATTPAEQTRALEEAITVEDRIVKDLSSAELDGDVKVLHDTFLKTLKIELDNLKKIQAAIDAEDTTAFYDAQDKSREDLQKSSQLIRDEGDSLYKKISDISRGLRDAEENVIDEYYNLKKDYEF